MAPALDRKLIFHPEICDALEQRFRQLKRKMAEINKRQAFVIEGARDSAQRPRHRARTVDRGIAAACIMLLPGPPHELKAMFDAAVPAAARRAWFRKQVIGTLIFRVAGMAESDLDQTIAPVYKKYKNPVTTILAPTATSRSICAPAARRKRRRRRCWPKSAGRSNCCWATASTRATAIRWK